MSHKILVTGGAGYIGSALVRRLLAEGHAVTVVDNLWYGQTSLFQFATEAGFTFVRGDVRDEALMRRLVTQADAVIPLAAIVGAGACDRDPLTATSVNFASIRLLRSLCSKDQQIIYPVTNSGYGTKSGDVYCTEETPMEPISLYGRDKVRAEQELLAGGNAVTLRLATVFGPSARMRLDLLVNHFVYTAVFDGYLIIFEHGFKRNFVHIDDVCACFVHCLGAFEQMRGRCFNLGLDTANLSKGELAHEIKKQIPNFCIQYSDLRSDPDKRNYIVSSARLREAGFTAERSLQVGIGQLRTLYSMLPRGPFHNA